MLVNDRYGVLADVTGPFCALAVDLTRSLQSLDSALRETLRSAATSWKARCLEPMSLDGACLGLSGIIATGAVRQVSQCVRTCLDSEGYPVAKDRVRVVSDIEIAHMAALGAKPGIVLIVGTGSVAFGRNERGESVRSDGWGWLLGDAGSGYEIGRSALRAVCASADGRGATTELSAAVLAHFGLQTVEELPRVVYQSLAPARVAAVAREVTNLAKRGDKIALSILDRAGEDLAITVMAALHRLTFETNAVPVSWQGGVISGSSELISRVQEHVTRQEPRCAFLPPVAEPVHGAVMLARR